MSGIPFRQQISEILARWDVGMEHIKLFVLMIAIEHEVRTTNVFQKVIEHECAQKCV